MRKPPKSAGPRMAAVELLRSTLEFRMSLDNQLQMDWFLKMSHSDQRLAKRITDGVLRNLLLLDFWIQELSNRPLRKIDVEVLWILRIGLYQIHFLRIPDYACIKETVELCRHYRKSSAVSFVNGLLRSFTRNPVSMPEGSNLSSISIRTSHPLWLVERFLQRYGMEKTLEALEFNNQLPEPIVRVNPFVTDREDFLNKLQQEEIPYDEIPGLNGAIKVSQASFHRHHLYLEGNCFFMDPSSQLIAEWPDLTDVQRAADLCSAPGGKSVLLASKLKDRILTSCDLSFDRLRIMKERMRSLQVKNLLLIQADLEKQPPFKSLFDFILLDVPCTGLGTISSNPEIRWLTEERDLMKFQDRQLTMLANGFSCLKAGGRLVYSTCSSEPEENEMVIERFLSSENDVNLVDYFLRPQPGRSGYFAVCLARK